MTGLTPDITTVVAVRHGVVALTFADGLRGEVDVLDRMHGPVFADARTPEASPRSPSTGRPAPSSGRAAQTSRRTRCMSASARACGRTRARRRRGLLEPTPGLEPGTPSSRDAAAGRGRVELAQARSADSG